MEHKKIKKHHIRSTQNQIRLLMNYMASHKNFSNSVSKKASPFEACSKAKEWSALRALLRKHGPDKSVEKWKQTWRDIKRKIRKQTLEANRSVETFDKDQVKFENDSLNNEFVKIDEQESCNEDVDLPGSSDGHTSKETQSKKFIRSTEAQNRILINYMESHKTFAYLSCKIVLNPLDASRKAREWSALRALLRKHGPDRTVKQWKTTWSNLKRRTLKPKSEVNKGENDTEHEPFSEFAESIEGVGAFIKEEPSAYPYEIPTVEVRSSSPMQLILTNTHSFASISASACTHTTFNSDPIYANVCSNVRSNNSSNFCAYENSPAASQCCLNAPNDGTTIDNLQIQENTLLQNMCKLLEERNSNLKMMNIMERRKIRFQYRRRY